MLALHGGTHFTSTLGIVDCKQHVIEYWDSLEKCGDAESFFKVCINNMQDY